MNTREGTFQIFLQKQAPFEALRFQGVDLGGASYIAALPGHTLDTVPEGPKLPHPVPPAPHLP